MYEFGVPYFISEGNFPYFDCTNRVSAVQRHPPHCSPITVVTPSTTTHCCYSCVCFSLAVQGCNPADGIALTLAEPNSVPTAFKLSFHVTLASTPGGGNPYKLVIWGQVPCPCCVTVQPPKIYVHSFLRFAHCVLSRIKTTTLVRKLLRHPSLQPFLLTYCEGFLVLTDDFSSTIRFNMGS